ncbi:MAG: redoxin family protein [Dehalococcoidia bacterium]|nr:redoxin family protein [Dehalococcoidia bacterium]
MPGLIDPRRLVAGAVALLALLAPLYVFLLAPGGDDAASIGEARLLETPSRPGQQVGLTEGDLAPDFELPSPDGEALRLSELRGRPVLINFWATWCASCLSEMPEIAALQQEKGEAFHVLAINAGESRADALEFIDFLDTPAFRFGLDQSLLISDAYNVYGLPMSVFIDADGVVRGAYQGHASRVRLVSLVDAAIQAKAPVEIAPELRPVTTIERDRIITLSRQGAGRLALSSRTLRCDLSYCAETWLKAIEAVAGVKELSFSTPGAIDPELIIDFDTALPEQMLIDEIVRLLEASQDPLYRRPVEVRYAD